MAQQNDQKGLKQDPHHAEQSGSGKYASPCQYGKKGNIYWKKKAYCFGVARPDGPVLGERGALTGNSKIGKTQYKGGKHDPGIVEAPSQHDPDDKKGVWHDRQDHKKCPQFPPSRHQLRDHGPLPEEQG